MAAADPLLDAVRRNAPGAVDALLSAHREYLRAVVALRFDNHMRGRVDESDVVQEACLEAARRLPDYLARRPMSLRPWLRQTAIECLLQIRRRHVEADCRAVGRELTLTDPSALLVAGRLLAGNLSPGGEADRQERAGLVRQALADLPDDDREVLLLRVYEGLDNGEAAEVLGVRPDAASKRFARALIRLRDRFDALGLSGASS